MSLSRTSEVQRRLLSGEPLSAVDVGDAKTLGNAKAALLRHGHKLRATGAVSATGGRVWQLDGPPLSAEELEQWEVTRYRPRADDNGAAPRPLGRPRKQPFGVGSLQLGETLTVVRLELVDGARRVTLAGERGSIVFDAT